jgi:uncharacterized DUF497 family protein
VAGAGRDGLAQGRQLFDRCSFRIYVNNATTWDEAKRQANISKHGMDLADAAKFDFDNADIEEDRDVRHEQRFRAAGYIGNRLCFLIFTYGPNDEPHAISLRPATPKEARRYAEG